MTNQFLDKMTTKEYNDYHKELFEDDWEDVKEPISEREIREGAYCTQCGKYMEEGKYYSRDGDVIYYFFHLFKKYKWKHYFCSEKCDKKFWSSYKDENEK